MELVSLVLIATLFHENYVSINLQPSALLSACMACCHRGIWMISILKTDKKLLVRLISIDFNHPASHYLGF
jgi:hypothetical protein